MAKNYLTYFPKPLLDDLLHGRWLPVVGAGMSLNASVPSGKKMPLWGDLGAAFADDLSDFVPANPLDAISAYQHEFTRAKLIERLTDLLLIRDAQPGLVHREFCSIPFDIVCTTNFDFLLEKQYDLIPRYVYPIVDEEQLSIGLEHPGTLLLKLHGDLRHPNRLVVTEEDYDGFLAKYPLLATYLSNLLITKTAVLIGYSLDDPDFRQLWQVVTSRLGKSKRPAYAITVGAKPGDVARFDRRGVKVINLPGRRDQYGEVLAAAFSQLREFMREKVISVSRVTEEKPLRELQLPRDTSTRLCFFALPLELLPFYRERVFPLIEDIGFVPVTADDVISPGDNVSAKIDALIDRAQIVVCDLASQWTRAEFRIALAQLKSREQEIKVGRPRNFRLIVVATQQDELPVDLVAVDIIVRPDIYRENPDEFIDRLVSVFREVSPTLTGIRLAEPLRLLQIGEYRAAVIAAMSALEATLRERMRKGDWTIERSVPLRQLIRMAQDREFVPPGSSKSLEDWLSLRNQVAHTNLQVSRKQAQAIVDGISRILG